MSGDESNSSNRDKGPLRRFAEPLKFVATGAVLAAAAIAIFASGALELTTERENQNDESLGVIETAAKPDEDDSPVSFRSQDRSTTTIRSTPVAKAIETTADLPKRANEQSAGVEIFRYSVSSAFYTGIDQTRAASEIATILTDNRGWSGDAIKLVQVEAPKGEGPANDPNDSIDFEIVISTPAEVDKACAPLRTNSYFSCRNGDKVIINSLRWLDSVEGWQGDKTTYRQYLINHEVGHMLGYSHEECGGPGQRAPVMMQQSKSIGDCVPNSWPYPNN